MLLSATYTYFVVFSKQVSNLFIINLQIRGVDQKFRVVRDLDRFKNMFKCPWNDSPLGCWIWDAHHTETLATASLAISKNCSIVTFAHAFHKWETNVIVDRLGCRVSVVGTIKCE